ncbi:PREDICTED: uncharacterized protein LOC106110320 [Papilio polytes]|uniref:uncharacterized protein LOC106110320 n=1 Tax=Papilio polytes TaxID=76194 RepID=UPI00067675D1|nr:PREDICTED: uncharacterized protein LOC106110320 [Papilio polytes]
MELPYPLLYVFLLSIATAKGINWPCDDYQANFTVKEMVGTWHVVAIIPEKLFPDNRDKITCYKVDFSETDAAGLQWLVNNTVGSKHKVDRLTDSEGTIIRQRYHSERPFDVWSMSIDGVNGCFRQVLSLDTDKTELSKAITHDDIMQLHLLETNDQAGPFLLQMLWGRMISVVVYRRQEGVTQEELKPVYEMTSAIRGPQRIPRICDRPYRDALKDI